MSFRNDRLKRRLEGLSTPPIQARHENRPVKMTSGDRIRVHATAEAIAAGVAGLVGDVVGFCTPSATGVAVIGTTSEDSAVKVSFKEKEGEFWFAKNQLEILGRAPGSENKNAHVDPEASATAKPKAWWRFGF